VAIKCGNARTIPSVVCYKENECVVGTDAKKAPGKYIKSTINEAKRYIGLDFDSPEVQRDMKTASYDVVDDGRNRPVFEVIFLFLSLSLLLVCSQVRPNIHHPSTAVQTPGR